MARVLPSRQRLPPTSPPPLAHVVPANDAASPLDAGGRLDATYVTYWSLRDPLCQSQSLPVVRALAANGWRIALMTYENPRWGLSPADAGGRRAALAAAGIRWVPLPYHKRPRVVATVFDVLRGVWTCCALAELRRSRLFHGRATVANAVAYLASRLTGARYFDDADGPLSEEYVDAGVWPRGSFVHRLTGWAEEKFLAGADAVAVLSDHRRREVAPRSRVPVTVLPCAVDTAHFVPRPEEGRRLRRQLDLQGTVLVYSGKVGGWYRGDAVVDFAAALKQVTGDVTLLVLTTDDPRPFMDRAAPHGVRCVAREASREEMPGYLSAAQAGLSFRLETASQRACSPIKNGEYLACGLPVVSTPGAGDYSALVVREKVGVVVERFDEAGLGIAAEGLARLLQDPGVADRCRTVARNEIGLDEVVVPRYLALYESLLGTDESRG